MQRNREKLYKKRRYNLSNKKQSTEAKAILITMVSAKALIAFSMTLASVLAVHVSSISQCPSLPARTAPPKDVTDLRIDDIKIIGALGDR
jgi:hypothetical protein